LDLNPSGDQRLHVWSEQLPRQDVRSSIHDHVFGIRSHVICGTLINIHYDAVPCEPEDEGACDVLRAERIPGTQNTELRSSGEFVKLIETRRQRLPVGSTYTFPPFELHDTGFYGLTATIMGKVAAPDGYGRPRVLVPVGDKPDNNFDREGFDPEDLWPFVDKALRLARWLES
jgi:hypothetical protein